MRIAARAAMILAVMILAGCSATRHVPPGKLLLDDVSVEIHDRHAGAAADALFRAAAP